MMSTAAEEEEMNSSSNKEISTVDVNVETVSKSEDHPLSKNLAILKNSILPDSEHEFTDDADLSPKMPPDPNLAYLENGYSANNAHHKSQEQPVKRRLNADKNEDGPSFLEEPEDVFLTRNNKPSTLKCAVKNALNAWFECSSGALIFCQKKAFCCHCLFKPHSNLFQLKGDPDSLQNKQIGNYVDPQTGIRTVSDLHRAKLKFKIN